MLLFLKDIGVDLTYKDTLKQSALYYAAREGKIGMIKILV